jgi:hypothetical protein
MAKTSDTVVVGGVRMSREAARCVEETGIDPADDIQAILAGTHSEPSLLAHCLDGADEDRVQGWHDYVAAIMAAVVSRSISLLAHCLDGADADRAQGWHDYVVAIMAAVVSRSTRCFLRIRSVYGRDSQTKRGHRASWIARGTGSIVYESSLQPFPSDAAKLAYKFALRCAWLIDTTGPLPEKLADVEGVRAYAEALRLVGRVEGRLAYAEALRLVGRVEGRLSSPDCSTEVKS